MLGVSVSCVIVNLVIICNLIASIVLPERNALSVIIVTVLVDAAGAALIIVLFNPAGSLSEGSSFLKASFCFSFHSIDFVAKSKLFSELSRRSKTDRSVNSATSRDDVTGSTRNRSGTHGASSAVTTSAGGTVGRSAGGTVGRKAGYTGGTIGRQRLGAAANRSRDGDEPTIKLAIRRQPQPGISELPY